MKTGMSKLFKGAALLALLGCSLNGLGAARAEAGVETGIGTAGATAGAAASTTNNIANFNADKNVVQAGGWSYLYAPATGAPSLLNKGDGTKFAADEWAQDIKNANHVWFVKANGQIGTDYKPIAFNYTASAAQAGKTVKVHGTYAATDSGHFQVLLSKDADASAVAGPYDTLFDYTGAGTSFDLNVTLQAGYDLMFVSRDHKY